jgi:hypothetical protein
MVHMVLIMVGCWLIFQVEKPITPVTASGDKPPLRVPKAEGQREMIAAEVCDCHHP